MMEQEVALLSSALVSVASFRFLAGKRGVRYEETDEALASNFNTNSFLSRLVCVAYSNWCYTVC